MIAPHQIVASMFVIMQELELPYVVVIGIGAEQKDELLDCIKSGEADGALVVLTDETGCAVAVETYSGRNVAGAKINEALREALARSGVGAVYVPKGLPS